MTDQHDSPEEPEVAELPEVPEPSAGPERSAEPERSAAPELPEPPLEAHPPAAPALTFDTSLRPLAPGAVTLWRIAGALSMVIWGPLIFLPVWMGDRLLSEDAPHWVPVIAIASVLAILQAVLRFVVFPQLRYRWWRFQLTADHLLLQRGLLVRRRTLIPLVRVQNVDTVQGPIARYFGLWSVVIFTAANAQSIPALSEAEADGLRTTLAELARRARDVD